MSAEILDHNQPKRQAFGVKETQVAYDEYLADLDQLQTIEARLVEQYNSKLTLARVCNKLGDARALHAEMKTLRAQIDKLRDSGKEAKARFEGKLDAIDASIVQKFQGLTALALGTGQGGVGVKYLHDLCLDFKQAKGFENRKAFAKSVFDVAGSLADSLDK